MTTQAPVREAPRIKDFLLFVAERRGICKRVQPGHGGQVAHLKRLVQHALNRELCLDDVLRWRGCGNAALRVSRRRKTHDEAAAKNKACGDEKRASLIVALHLALFSATSETACLAASFQILAPHVPHAEFRGRPE